MISYLYHNRLPLIFFQAFTNFQGQAVLIHPRWILVHYPFSENWYVFLNLQLFFAFYIILNQKADLMKLNILCKLTLPKKMHKSYGYFGLQNTLAHQKIHFLRFNSGTWGHQVQKTKIIWMKKYAKTKLHWFACYMKTNRITNTIFHNFTQG